MKSMFDVLLFASLAIASSPAYAGHSQHVADSRAADSTPVGRDDADKQRWTRGFPRLPNPLRGRQPQEWRFDGTTN